MKTTTFRILLSSIATLLLFYSCDNKKTENNESVKNIIVFDGTEYEVTGINLFYTGQRGYDEPYYTKLEIEGEDIFISIGVFSANEGVIPKGHYTSDSQGYWNDEGTVYCYESWIGDDKFRIADGGTLKVTASSGTSCAFSFDGSTTNGEKLTITYSGKANYEDYSIRPVGEGKITVAGTEYTFDFGAYVYERETIDYISKTYSLYGFMFGDSKSYEGLEIYISLFTTNTYLQSGEYKYEYFDGFRPQTPEHFINDLYFFIGEYIDGEAVSGKLDVTISGSTYTFHGTFVDDWDNEVMIEYSGELVEFKNDYYDDGSAGSPGPAPIARSRR